jgi:AbrB family looped-hinge helix DNA binding protein
MNKARITFKGQVTIPKEVREALTIQEGDTVLFEVEGDHAILKPLKKKFLTDFYGALPANRPYPGLDAIRKEVHRKMGKRLHRKGGA